MPINLPLARHVSEPPKLSQPLGPNAVVAKAAGGDFRIDRLVLEGGRRDGVEILVVDTGKVQAAILPTRGLSLWRARIDGIDIGWKSPVDGPIHPQWVALAESGGLGWLDGFDELVVRCGLRNFGAPDYDAKTNRLAFPLHGRIGNLPTENLEIEIDAAHSLLHVRGRVAEQRFLQYNLELTASYTFAIGSSTIAINDSVRNASDTTSTMQMLYHINVGEPILDAGAKLHLGTRRIVARNVHAANDIGTWANYSAPKAGYEEQVYFSASASNASGWATAMLAAPNGQTGFAVHYETKSLPYFTQWKNTVGRNDGYVTGIEPGTGFPNPRSFELEKGRVVQLESQQSIHFNLKLEGIAAKERIAELAMQLDSQQGGRVETVAFDADWCTPRN